MINITGLWKAESKNGKPYLRGRLGNAVIMVFPNERKTDEKQPDYRVVIGESKREQASKELESGKGFEAQTKIISKDDIPF